MPALASPSRPALPATASGDAPGAADGERLSHWLRLLWDVAPPLHFDTDVPCVVGGALHLPAAAPAGLHRAAASHAAAHLVYSPPGFDGSGLVPLARTLVVLLEDARVESLAMRELPGLARLWAAWHTATPALGDVPAALLARLSRALIDPLYDDPHPWVRKGRGVFFVDPALGATALRTPAEVRDAASRLGHDLGQMRLPFDARGWRPTPDYRDDGRWMWPADRLEPASPPPAPAPARRDAVPTTDREPDAAPPMPTARHAEWDYLIGRHRADWCGVVEIGPDDAPRIPAGAPIGADLQRLARALGRALRAARSPRRWRAAEDGEVPIVDGLVRLRLARRSGIAADARVFRSFDRPAGRKPDRAAMAVLIDQSASTATRPHPGATSGPVDGGTGARDPAPHGETVLRTATHLGAALGLAAQSAGLPCLIASFHSNGRHAVTVRIAKRFDDRADAALATRLAALRPTGSTRLGGALRHVAEQLAARRRDGPVHLLLLSDGEARDIDSPDRRYLPADARQAIRDAAVRGVAVRCLCVGERRTPRLFRGLAARAAPTLARVPAQLRALFRRDAG